MKGLLIEAYDGGGKPKYQPHESKYADEARELFSKDDAKVLNTEGIKTYYPGSAESIKNISSLLAKNIITESLRNKGKKVNENLEFDDIQDSFILEDGMLDYNSFNDLVNQMLISNPGYFPSSDRDENGRIKTGTMYEKYKKEVSKYNKGMSASVGGVLLTPEEYKKFSSDSMETKTWKEKNRWVKSHVPSVSKKFIDNYTLSKENLNLDGNSFSDYASDLGVEANALDVIGTTASYFPGVGNVAGFIAGLGAAGLRLADDWDEQDKWGNFSQDIGWALLNGVPFSGAFKAGKVGKIAKNIVSTPLVRSGLVAWQGSEAWKGIGNNAVNDWSVITDDNSTRRAKSSAVKDLLAMTQQTVNAVSGVRSIYKGVKFNKANKKGTNEPSKNITEEKVVDGKEGKTLTVKGKEALNKSKKWIGRRVNGTVNKVGYGKLNKPYSRAFNISSVQSRDDSIGEIDATGIDITKAKKQSGQNYMTQPISKDMSINDFLGHDDVETNIIEDKNGNLFFTAVDINNRTQYISKIDDETAKGLLNEGVVNGMQSEFDLTDKYNKILKNNQNMKYIKGTKVVQSRKSGGLVENVISAFQTGNVYHYDYTRDPNYRYGTGQYGNTNGFDFNSMYGIDDTQYIIDESNTTPSFSTNAPFQIPNMLSAEEEVIEDSNFKITPNPTQQDIQRDIQRNRVAGEIVTMKPRVATTLNNNEPGIDPTITRTETKTLPFLNTNMPGLKDAIAKGFTKEEIAAGKANTTNTTERPEVLYANNESGKNQMLSNVALYAGTYALSKLAPDHRKEIIEKEHDRDYSVDMTPYNYNPMFVKDPEALSFEEKAKRAKDIDQRTTTIRTSDGDKNIVQKLVADASKNSELSKVNMEDASVLRQNKAIVEQKKDNEKLRKDAIEKANIDMSNQTKVTDQQMKAQSDRLYSQALYNLETENVSNNQSFYKGIRDIIYNAQNPYLKSGDNSIAMMNKAYAKSSPETQDAILKAKAVMEDESLDKEARLVAQKEFFKLLNL